jgi:two-component system, OmpR family, sensor histidine kinase BaeS
MKYSLRTKLSATIAMVSLLTIAIISLFSNFLIEGQFKSYITRQQEATTKEIVSTLGQQYNSTTGLWDTDFVHTIGMYALYDGYIVKVYDLQKKTVWDAEECDMTSCTQVMDDITHRMITKYPQINGKFTSKDFPIVVGTRTVGTVNISFYGPYFLSANDFAFLDSLNMILIWVGAFSLALSVIVGIFIARRLSRPILKTAGVAKQISDGDYQVRIEKTTDTKEVNELILSINQLADSLGKQESLRKQLTSDVAHELRTPLTTLQTHMEAMVEGVWQPTTERLQSCHDEILRLGRLVKDLESLAKVESDNLKLEKTQVSLSDIVTAVLDSFEVALNDKNMKVSVQGNCPDISADHDRISQVVINLLSNAIKYSPNGGDISVTLSEKNQFVQLCVKDSGIGIPEKEIPLIFERFYRADQSRNRNTGGTGIGLAIVKSIVTAHGGSVTVESVLDKGSCFTVSLPR